ncbi:Desumoylating isopeptidase 2 [Thelohanellus kitauei]|uniref:Desumoylating isopeptidase 2 n=1 Tax=Thelohanellus kitauei TaxID=669202 RepID=A0A0C2ISB9_THEKT|nr:Desumoylating isopeptidase 2 [Thelohanellus kitauei]
MFGSYLCWKCSNPANEEEYLMGSPVRLKIYDVIKDMSLMDFFGLGVYHTTVEVFDKEYTFGASDDSFEGIKCYPAGYLDSIDIPYTFRETMLIGYTLYDEAQVDEIIRFMQRDYTSQSYDIILHNCNHFTQDFIKVLCNRNIPKYINRLASIVSSNSFFHKIARSIYDGRPPLDPNI